MTGQPALDEERYPVRPQVLGQVSWMELIAVRSQLAGTKHRMSIVIVERVFQCLLVVTLPALGSSLESGRMTVATQLSRY